MKDNLKTALRGLGIELGRYKFTFKARRQRLIDAYGVSTLIDVGANIGQYGRELRRHGYKGAITSFEPLPAAFADLQQIAADDPRWRCEQTAVGESAGTLVMNVASHDIFSSARSLTRRNLAADPQTRTIATQEVPVATLDDLVGPMNGLAVKIDVQGYEDQVVAGGQRTLSSASLIEMELSLTSLYEGQWLIEEALSELRHMGFELALTENIMPDAMIGRALQLNGLFVKEDRTD
jgi:FkbM family methyltransferase